MQDFDEVGITYLTASSIGAFRDNPAWWCMRYLYGRGNAKAPAIVRGIAIKDGLRHYLYKGDMRAAEDQALASYKVKIVQWGLEDHPEAENEHDNILPMFDGACQAFDAEKLGVLHAATPVTSDMASSVWADGLDAPFLSSPAFVFADRIIDVKATKRCPSKPVDRDVTNCAIHYKVKPLPIYILYVTHKKHNLLKVGQEDLDRAWLDLVLDAQSLQRFIKTAETREHALGMVPLNIGHFRWDEQLLGEAKEVLQLSEERINAIAYARSTEELRDTGSRDSSGHLLSDD